LNVILQKLDTVDFDELFVASQKNPYILMTTLGRQVLIPVLHSLFTKIALPEIHVSLNDDGTDTLDVTDMILVVPEFPDKINTRTEIDNVFVRNKKAKYDHSEMLIKLCVGITNVPCDITGTKFDFSRRSFPRIHRDGHLNLSVTGMDVGLSISILIPTPESDLNLDEFNETNVVQALPDKTAPTDDQHKEKGKEKEEHIAKDKEHKPNPVEQVLPTIRCDDAQLFKLHGFSLEFQDDVKNAELLNSFSSHFEREICFGVSALVANQLAEIMKEACIHMTNMVRLTALQSRRLAIIVNKKSITTPDTK